MGAITTISFHTSLFSQEVKPEKKLILGIPSERLGLVILPDEINEKNKLTKTGIENAYHDFISQDDKYLKLLRKSFK